MTIQELQFGIHVRKRDTLPIKNSPDRRLIVTAGDLDGYKKLYSGTITYTDDAYGRRIFTVPEWESGIKNAMAGQLADIEALRSNHGNRYQFD